VISIVSIHPTTTIAYFVLDTLNAKLQKEKKEHVGQYVKMTSCARVEKHKRHALRTLAIMMVMLVLIALLVLLIIAVVATPSILIPLGIMFARNKSTISILPFVARIQTVMMGTTVHLIGTVSHTLFFHRLAPKMPTVLLLKSCDPKYPMRPWNHHRTVLKAFAVEPVPVKQTWIVSTLPTRIHLLNVWDIKCV